MNPARSLGPALFAGGEPLAHVWLFILAPLVGAALAAVAVGRSARRCSTEEAVRGRRGAGRTAATRPARELPRGRRRRIPPPAPATEERAPADRRAPADA